MGMIKEPQFASAPTFRNFEDHQYGAAYADGWNEAMRFIFQEELEKEKLKIKSCWLLKSGYHVCKTCRNRNNCEVAE